MKEEVTHKQDHDKGMMQVMSVLFGTTVVATVGLLFVANTIA